MFGKVKKLIASVLAVTMLITLAPSQLVTVMADTHFSGIEHSDNIVLPQAAPGGGQAEKQYAGTYNKKVNQKFEIESEHDGKNWYVANDDKNVKLSDKDDDSVKVKCSAPGRYEIAHEYGKGKDKKTEWFLVNIEDTQKTTVYVYLNTENVSDYNFDGIKTNGNENDSWYTVGSFQIDTVPSETNGWTSMTSEISSLVQGMTRYSDANTNIPTDVLAQAAEYQYVYSSGATDYVKSEGNTKCWHLNLKLPEKPKTTVYVYLNQENVSDYGYSGIKTNGDAGGWYTVGSYQTSTAPAKACDWTPMTDDIRSLVRNMTRYTGANTSIPTEDIANAEYYRYVYTSGATSFGVSGKQWHLDLKLPQKKEATVKVAVYATDGSLTGKNANLESRLGISFKQADGYYPIGVIEVPETLVSGNSPYINSPEDWETIKAAIKEISTKELTGDGLANINNTIYQNLDKVQVDLNQEAGTWRTAMFDWSGSSKNIDGDYDYHLDLRFATNLLTVIGAYEQNDGKFAVDSNYLAQIPYLTGENTTEPTIDVPEGYKVDGYYSDADLKTEYTFGASITSNQTVYVKLKKIETTYTINYYLNNSDNAITVKTPVTKSAKYGDVITLTEADKTKSGYTFKNADRESLTIGTGSNVINLYFYKNVTLEANSETFVYDGTAKTVAGYTVSGELEGIASDFSNKVTATRTEKEAGIYTVNFSSSPVGTVDNNEKYIVTDATAGTLIINKASDMILTVYNYEGTYDGKAHGKEAESDKVGTKIEYSTNDGTTWSTTAPSITNAGTINVKVRATNDNYETVEKSYTLKVNPKDVTITVYNANKVYGEVDPTFTGEVTGLVNSTDLGTITYYRENATTDTAAKTYTGVLKARYTSNSNYKVTVNPGNFTITAADSNKLGLVVTDYSGTYDGTSHGTTASVTVTEGTTIEYSTDGTRWNTSAPTVKDVTNGKVSVQVRATNSNYTTATASYTLEVKPAEATVTADDKSKVYGNADPTFTAQVTGLVNGEAESLISYKLSRESGENVDKTYKITPSGDAVQGNYNVTFATGTLTITPQSIGPESNTNVTAENPENVVYNGTEQKQKVVVKDGDTTLVEGTDYELSYSAETTNVGTVTVTVTGKGNYTGSKTVTYQITQKPVIVTADDKAKIFGETDSELTYRVEGLVGNDNSSIISVKSIEREKGETVVEGGYPITISGEESQGNYIVSYVNGIFTINPKTIEDPDKDNPGEYPDDYNGIKVGTIDDVTYTGDSQKLVPSIPGLVEGTDYTITYSTDTTNAGTVTVTVKGIGNYTGTVTRIYNINKRVVTLTSASAGKVFDGTALTAQSVTVSGQGFAKNEGEGVTYIFSGAQTGVGSIANAFEYTLNTAVINPNNYVITVVYGTLTVAAAPVTEPDTPTPTAVTHTLTIHYVDEAGNAVAPDYVGTFVTGSSYLVASPVVLGYTPQFASVASPEGGMPDMDVEVSVLYTPNVPVVPQDNGTPEVTTNVPDNGGAGNVPNDAGGQAVDNNANVNDANTEIPDADVPQGALSVDENGNVEIVEIEDEETALAANTAKAWALINLLAMIATAVLGIVLLVLALKKKKEEEEDENAVKAESEENEDEAKEKNKKVLKLCGLIPAIASVIVFFLTENMKNPMAYVDKWTVLMVILLVVEIVLAVLSKKKKEEKEDDTQAPQEA